ncbi:uncharacterized protein BDZ99DRAFT_515360 [Mytilinidion resinicola]|uniref:Uncharacterized protein n=1 Tax=Mytilinidion resinicola TaxID=574789 RepID=A0A6A6Z0F9_9PEZI|nr:uncharacterized protein BDZ99DRAFT_515360 [Mytilinidion resinicola]KAF2814571.1 hypothetical protein BDZ99DRAFT_515360 [Mytilinidion resinicola]
MVSKDFLHLSNTTHARDWWNGEAHTRDLQLQHHNAVTQIHHTRQGYFFTIWLDSFVEILRLLPMRAHRKKYNDFLARRVLEDFLPQELCADVADLLKPETKQGRGSSESWKLWEEIEARLGIRCAGIGKEIGPLCDWSHWEEIVFIEILLPRNDRPEPVSCVGRFSKGEHWYWSYGLLPTVLDHDIIPTEKSCDCSLCKTETDEEWTRQVDNAATPEDPGLAVLPFSQPETMVQQLHKPLRSVEDSSAATGKFKKILPKLEEIGLDLTYDYVDIFKMKDLNKYKPWIMEISAVFQHGPTEEIERINTYSEKMKA